MSATDAETIRKGIAALNRGDADGIAAVLTADVELLPMSAAVDGTVYRGHDGMRSWLAELAEDWDEYALTLESVEELTAGRVLVHAAVSMRGRSSGVVLDTPAAWLCEMRGGQVARIQFFMDPDEARAAVSP